MRFITLVLAVCLTVAAVQAQGKDKGKGKGKAAKPEEAGESVTAVQGKGKGKGESGATVQGKGKGKGESAAAVQGKGKGKGKGDSGAAVQGKGKGKGKGASGEKGPKSGFCVSQEEMMMICHADSSLGEKAFAAMGTCAEQFNMTMGEMMEERSLIDMRAKKPKGKGKGKGKGKPSKKPSKCPTVAEIMEMAGQKYAGELCIFTEMGWLDNDLVSDDALILADIQTLPTEISEALTGDGYDQCVQEFESEAMTKMEGMEKCAEAYTEEEEAELAELLNGVAHTECFMTIFEESCGLYMSNALAAMYPAARK